MENRPRHRRRLRENIPRRGVVFPALVARAVLTVRHEEVQVVRADVVLGEVDYGLCEGLFAVVVGCVFGDVADELGDLVKEGVLSRLCIIRLKMYVP